MIRTTKHAALATIATLGLAVAGCGDVDVKINDDEGVPLAQLDMDGAAPNQLVVSTAARVMVSDGENLDIEVDGDTDNALRFTLKDGVIGITSEKGADFDRGAVTVRLTMPAPESIVVAAAGNVSSETLAPDSSLLIGGSGSIDVASIEAEALNIAIGGSGSVSGAGTTENLEIAIGGSGDIDLAELTANNAEVSIGGSGDVQFASDGVVEANIGGAGEVRVSGDADCTLNSFGSGKLICTP